MPESFDPYHQWLGIPSAEQPPDHYRLLGVARFEANVEVIRSAADRQTVHLNTFRGGPRGALAKRLLDEVQAARLCLLDPTRKAAYDRRLPGPCAEGALSDDDLDGLLSQVDETGPKMLAPLPRRRKPVWPWVKRAAIVTVVLVAVALAVSVVRFGLRRLEAYRESARASRYVDDQPSAFLGPAELPVVPPAESLEPPLPRVFAGHGRPVTALAFAPNGRTLVSAAKDGRVGLWEVDSGQELWKSPSEGRELAAVVFGPDGTWLAAGGDSCEVKIRDAKTWEVRRTLSGHTRPVRALAVLPDGATLASTGLDGTLRLWDPTAGLLRKQWIAHQDGVMAAVFSPDGSLLATGGLNGAVRLWTVGGESRHVLAGNGSAVRALAFHPEGKLLASADERGGARLWDVETGALKATLTGHTDRVSAVAFSRDGKTLFSAGYRRDPVLRAWNATTGEAVRILSGHASGIASLAVSPDGRQLASGDYAGRILLWDAVER
ncbi:MAG: WD40 repeat domain-containing protein [Pirellulales bacterium]|nr:WD40 repeat domain-containing protein [Pirellulales bacterium]